MAYLKSFTTTDQYQILRMLGVPDEEVPIWMHHACALIERKLNAALPTHRSQRHQQEEEDALLAQQIHRREKEKLAQVYTDRLFALSLL